MKEHKTNATAYRKESAGDILDIETMARCLVLMPKNEVAQDHHEKAQGKDHGWAIRMVTSHTMEDRDDCDDHGDRQEGDIGEQTAHKSEPREGKKPKSHARQQTVDGTNSAGIGS